MKRALFASADRKSELLRRALAGENRFILAAEFGISRKHISTLISQSKKPAHAKQPRSNPNACSRWPIHTLPVLAADTPMQTCERLEARLSVHACAERSRRADKGHEIYATCRACPVGQRNARDLEVAQ